MTLAKPQRRELEKVITQMRERIENDIEYQVKQIYGLENKDEIPSNLDDEERETRERLIEAVEREAIDGYSWAKALELYIKGTGYTVVNRLAALRCMEVRGLDMPNFEHGDRAVTQLRDDGRTPAADPLIENFEVTSREEGILEAYRRACNGMQEELEILFDLDNPYSVIDPDFDAFEDLLEMLDNVDEEIWAADDVLGWVYEYYETDRLDELRDKAEDEGLDPDEVPPANQFYTPHWIVRMLTDNSLGRLYLEHTGDLSEVVENQRELSTDERLKRIQNSNESDISNLCSYLVPADEAGEPTDFSSPSEIRVLDPACGSGHFLLYAFDVLERIWWNERPEVPKEEVPIRILEHNLYGIDLDLRACQLTAFNLYLKARTRAEEEGAERFDPPNLNIVCSDSAVANLDEVEEFLTNGQSVSPRVMETLENIVDTFQSVDGLGSLLDVQGTLEEALLQGQTTLAEDWEDMGEIRSSIDRLKENLHAEIENGSFVAQDLESFLHLLVVLTTSYDVTLMNPPYGTKKNGRMPQAVKDYIEDHYEYHPDYFVAFFEACERLLKDHGRVGMIIKREWMYKKSFRSFREEFIGRRGAVDFLAEFGEGVLDNAKVRTIGTVVRSGTDSLDGESQFIRLHDPPTEEKEAAFAETLTNPRDQNPKRLYRRPATYFQGVPGSPLSYWVPPEIRELYDSSTVFDADNADVDRESLGRAKQGLATGKDPRFYHYFWEVEGDFDRWVPIAKGGEDAWILPRITETVLWKDKGAELKRFDGSYIRNEQYYFREGLTWTYIKESGRRFGYLNPESVFSHAGNAFLADSETWPILSFANSHLFTYLMLGLNLYRGWGSGKVAQIPWDSRLNEVEELSSLAKELLGLKVSLRQYDLQSPYYRSPKLLAPISEGEPVFHSSHPHREILNEISIEEPEDRDESTSISALANGYTEFKAQLSDELNEHETAINNAIFETFDLADDTVDTVLTEVELRTNEDPREGVELDGEDEDVEYLVKEFLLHVAFEVVQEDEDGIVLLDTEGDEEEEALLSRIADRMERYFGDHAQERLEEIDRILGDSRSMEGRFKNIEQWLQEDLFQFQLEILEDTPILWKITTRNLVAEPRGEGLSCLVDYHELDAGLFDTIQTRYIDTREKLLRERRNRANQDRSDSSLSATEQAEADEEYQRCEDALRQIDEFKQAARQLSEATPSDIDQDISERARGLKSDVQQLRRRLENRFQAYDDLKEIIGEEAMADRFTPTFPEKLEAEKDEWIDALQALEDACEAYASADSSPPEAHHYDLFVYIPDRLGKFSYHSRNKILWALYYFRDRGEEFLRNEEAIPGAGEEEELLATMAMDMETDRELAANIKVACEEIEDALESDWEDRARVEITANGYRPKKKHGVRINIKPLADAGIVPDVVEERVL